MYRVAASSALLSTAMAGVTIIDKHPVTLNPDMAAESYEPMEQHGLLNILNDNQCRDRNSNGRLYYEVKSSNVMVNAIGLYGIFYGDWQTPPTGTGNGSVGDDVVTRFMKDVGQSSWPDILTDYFQTNERGNYKRHVTSTINYGDTTYAPINSEAYLEYGASIDAEDIAEMVVSQVVNGNFPGSEDNIYFFIVSKDVTVDVGGDILGTDYCGVRMYATHETDRYSIVVTGDPTNYATNCIKENTEFSPNNNVAGDAMVNMVSYGIAAAATNPFGGAWSDRSGDNAGDKCRFRWGPNVATNSDGSKYNTVICGRKYLIQEIWDNSQLCCVDYSEWDN